MSSLLHTIHTNSSQSPLNAVDHIDDTLGHRIRAARKSKQWCQQHLADKAGVSRATLSHLEANKGNPTQRSVALVLKALEIAEEERPSNTVTIPPNLHEFALTASLSYAETVYLLSLRLKPTRERTQEDWKHLYHSMQEFPRLYEGDTQPSGTPSADIKRTLREP